MIFNFGFFLALEELKFKNTIWGPEKVVRKFGKFDPLRIPKTY